MTTAYDAAAESSLVLPYTGGVGAQRLMPRGERGLGCDLAAVGGVLGDSGHPQRRWRVTG